MNEEIAGEESEDPSLITRTPSSGDSNIVRTQRSSRSAIETIGVESEWSFRSSFSAMKIGRSERALIVEKDDDLKGTRTVEAKDSRYIDEEQLDGLKNFLFESWTLDTGHKLSDASTRSLTDVDLGSIFETTFDLTEDRLRRLFNLIDKSNGGTITYEELKIGFAYHDHASGASKLDDRTFWALVEYLDADKSGEITFEEFSEGIRLLMLRSIMQKINRPGSPANKDTVVAQVYDYNMTQLERYFLHGMGQIQQVKSSFVVNSKPIVDFFLRERGDEVSVRWINITGKKASNIMKMMALKYRLHPLALEDALERFDHRPKADSYDGHYFIMVPVFYLKSDNPEAIAATAPKETERTWRLFGITANPQSETESGTDEDDEEESVDEDGEAETNLIGVHMTSIFITKPSGSTVITFNNEQSDNGIGWQTLQDELKKDYSKLRHYDGQYLAYRLLDEAVDKIGRIVKKLKKHVREERKTLIRNHYKDLDKIHALKQEMYSMSRKFKPFLRLLVHVIEDDSFSPGASIYLRDVLDNLEIHDDDIKTLIAKCDSVDSEAEKLQAKQMDSTLYTLTIATVTILPAQFLTGVWGMNFESMPELQWQYGYSIFWILAFASAVTTVSILNFSRHSTNF